MNQNHANPCQPRAALRVAAAAVIALGLCQSVQAQVPGRFYWKSLSGGSAVPLIFESVSGNTNPFDSSHRVSAGAEFDATMAMAGYAQTFSLFDRSAMAAVILPMGRLSGEATKVVNGASVASAQQSASGFGDPMLEFDINLIGPKAQKTIPDAVRYEPGFSLDVLADLALPIGEYDSKQALNLGQNRWYGRIGAPMVMQIGSWVPGRRTTFELLPSAWIFGDNTNYVGQTLKTDPLFQLDAHLTRDFNETLWGSLDASWYNGGKATINGVAGDKRNDIAYGLTIGMQINPNTSLTFGYKSTANDSGTNDMRLDSFMITLISGWHPIIEGSRRLKGE
ncbi:transporter [Uliginosibacterium aquaticum]|uniref:Transporter n=1 Tax=Uliginosibacterium aquaticum TaxID=2731212 RepID=A0ABX2IEX8_9RHOO|nr:transporter [Uliginosibacterium aquaticum]NSL55214.1 transporter [Uliginosibacterium aquaticum]